MATPSFTDEHLLFTPATPRPGAIPVVFAFPNQYSVGITSLGYQALWGILASREDVQVSRLFTDLAEPLPRRSELLGFSFAWELDYGHIFDLLERLQVPLLSDDRTEEHPLVFGGGPVLTANPEPFAAFFDVILLGDGEDLLPRFVDAYGEVRQEDRPQQLRRLAQVPGVYVPSLYQVTYQDPTGAIAAITPLDATIPPVVQKQTYRGNALLASTVVTAQAAWESIYLVEVVRSCPEMCRFCLASYLTLPFRTAALDGSLIPAIDRGLTVTSRLGLLGASVTQHPEFPELLDRLRQPAYDSIRLSIASVRTNTVTETLARTLAQRGTQSLTIAVESGSDRLRHIINKKLDTAAIFAAAQQAKAGGLQGLKLYGMVGIPGETDEDVAATADLMVGLKRQTPGLRFTLGCSTFVPKAHTPFQWLGLRSESQKRLQWLQKRLGSQGIEFRPESYNWSVIQALLSRGDRRLAPLLTQVRHYGDSLGSYRRVFKALRGQLPPLEFYVHQTWQGDQVLPWQHLQGPLPVATLRQHLQQALPD